MKRLLDVLISLTGIILLSPVISLFVIAVYLQDFHNPFYVASRVGIHEKPFKMFKLRSMIINADKSGVASTSNDDKRITKVGRLIRQFKLDEIVQLFNVLKGDMSLVGPRPNVQVETDLYSLEEKKLLSVRPGITDFSSIVFSDEGAILEGRDDPDLSYNQLIRPGKGFLGLVYIQNRSLLLDIKLILITFVAIFSRDVALKLVVNILRSINTPPFIVDIAARQRPLSPLAPPGMSDVVTSR